MSALPLHAEGKQTSFKEVYVVTMALEMSQDTHAHCLNTAPPCRWVAALQLLVGILRAEHKAALSVWPSEYTAAEPAFNEVISRSVVAATHAGAFIVASKRMPEKACLL